MLDRYLSNVKRNTENICIGLSKMDKTGGNEKINELIQLKFLYSVFVQLPPFVVDNGYFQIILLFQPLYILNHLYIRSGLREHKFTKLINCERAFLVEHYSFKVFIQGNLSLFISNLNYMMPFIHFVKVQIKNMSS